MCAEIHIARPGPIPAPAPWATVHRLMAGVRLCSAFSILVTFRAIAAPKRGPCYSWGVVPSWPVASLNMPGRFPPQGLCTDCPLLLDSSPRCLHCRHSLTCFSFLLRCPLPINTFLAVLPSGSFLHSTSHHLLCVYLISSASYLLSDYKPLEGRIFLFCSLFMFLGPSGVPDT